MSTGLRRHVTPLIVVLGVIVVSGGPLLRVRTWWSFDDPLEGDVVLVVIRVLVGVLGAAALVRSGRWRGLSSPAWILWVALVAWLSLTAAWSVRPAVTLRESLLVGATLLGGAGAAAVLSPRQLRWSVFVGLHVGLGWSALATVLVARGTQDELGNWVGVFFNRNSLALVAAIGIWSALWVLAEAGRDVTEPVACAALRVAMVVAVLADAVLIVRSGSLTPVVALATMALVIVGLGVVGRRVVSSTAAVPVVLAGAGMVTVAAAIIAWWARASLANAVGRDANLSGRAEVWGVAWDWFRDRPLVGHGYLGPGATVDFQYEVYQAQGMVLTSAHGTFMDVLMGAGVIGGALLIAALVANYVAVGRPVLVAAGTEHWWALAAFALVVTLHGVETLLVGGHLTVALIGLTVAAPLVARHPEEVGAPR